MKSTFSTIVLGAALAASAQAASFARADWTSSLLARGVLPRQGTPGPEDVPAQCVAGCAPVNEQLANQCPPTSCCTSTFTDDYITCFVCIASATGITDYSDGVETLRVLREACAARGFPVAEAVFPDPDSLPSTTPTPTPTSPLPSPSTTSQTTITDTDDLPSQTTVREGDATGLPDTAGNGATSMGSAVISWVLPLVAVGIGVMLV